VVEYYGLAPMQKISLGVTTRTDDELRTFLRSISHRFTMETYDLFNNNCNNFSDEVSKFLLNKGIPQFILDVPSKVLATPMGSMIGQMMKGMQSRMGANMGSNDPFTAMATARGQDSIVPTGSENFNTSSSSSSSTSTTSSSISTPSKTDIPTTNILTTHIRPLISNEVDTVSIFIQRLHSVNSTLPSDSPHRLTALQLTILNDIPKYLQSFDNNNHDNAPVCTPDGVCTLPLKRRKEDTTTNNNDWQKPIIQLCNELYSHWPHTNVLFPLFGILRLIILREDCLSVLLDKSVSSLLWDIIETLNTKNGYIGNTTANTIGINTFALSCIVNLFGTVQGTQWIMQSASLLNAVIDITLRHLHYEINSKPCKEIRQMSTALLYNITNSLPIGSDTNPGLTSTAGGTTEGNATVQITDISIQLLCAIFDNISYDDHDSISLERLFISAGRLFSREGFEAVELMNTLGYHDTLFSIIQNNNKKYSTRIQSLAKEVQQKLNTSSMVM